jgi:PAS domain S-box-containing protein
MKDNRRKTKKQLSAELESARQRLAGFESADPLHSRNEEHDKIMAAHDLYRTVFEATGAATIVIEDDMRIFLANKEFERLTGYSQTEIAGSMKWTDFIADSDRLIMKDYHRRRRIDQSSAPRNYEVRLVNRFGEMKDIMITVDMIGGTNRSVASFLDITEHKQRDRALEESEQKYRLLAENVLDIIWTVDLELRYLYVSPSVEKLLGYTADEIIGKTVDMILTKESLLRARQLLSEDRERERKVPGKPFQSRTVELQQVHKDGTLIWTEHKMTFLRDSDNRPVEILGVTRDISKRRQAEEALRRSKLELELKSKYLEEANTALKVLLHHKDDDKIEFQSTVLANVRELVLPCIEKIKACRTSSEQSAFLSILELNLRNIISPFLRNMTVHHFNLTPRELQVATFVKEGKSSKEISELLNLSPRAIEFHRENIRKKLGLRNKKMNLRSYLLTLS